MLGFPCIWQAIVVRIERVALVGGEHSAWQNFRGLGRPDREILHGGNQRIGGASRVIGGSDANIDVLRQAGEGVRAHVDPVDAIS